MGENLKKNQKLKNFFFCNFAPNNRLGLLHRCEKMKKKKHNIHKFCKIHNFIALVLINFLSFLGKIVNSTESGMCQVSWLPGDPGESSG